ncbi:response regulator [Vibrio methylphosphonaticus]|uniref:response regulator n=1 Tax=Vibrio methylphosphonaticus TaxID=2946866 RepID=UPI002029F531|nr:response regulator [Vibrio methylphosphonaticus]MCL9774898.1 response regulator [Vibrio methylphosphonaticus]
MSALTRVMIIEDDQKIAELHRRYLEKMGGFEVVGIATSRSEAEIQLELLEPELVMLDVYLPDGTGIDILGRLRTMNQACDVILITAARDVETLQQAMRGGVIDYLLKPVMYPRLESALKKYQKRTKQLHHMDGLDQSLVDEMMQSHTAEAKADQYLPKGIDGVTLEKIRTLFNEHGLYTADEAGENIGASRTTARRYLEFLISTGELEADVNYGSVGRPERCYRRLARE